MKINMEDNKVANMARNSKKMDGAPLGCLPPSIQTCVRTPSNRTIFGVVLTKTWDAHGDVLTEQNYPNQPICSSNALEVSLA
jgi:hypothetical protein